MHGAPRAWHRRRSARWLAVLLGSASCRTPPPAAAPAAESTYLWRIERGDERGWLLGSVHLAVESSRVDAALTRAYESADSLAVELDVDAIPVGEVVDAFAKHGHYPEGTTLRESLGDEDYGRVQAIVRERGLVLGNLEQLRPWVLSMVLLTSTPAEPTGDEGGGSAGGDIASGGGFSMGIDRWLLATARGNKPIHSLETLDEQIAAFSSADDALQLESLRRTLSALELGHNPMLEIVKSYFEGDVEQVLAEEHRAAEADETFGAAALAYERALIRDRNVHMAERIADLLRDGHHPFVVVGVAHLLGEGSIPQLLTGMGYALVPVPPTGERVTVEPPPGSEVRLPTVRVAAQHMDWPTEPSIQRVPFEGNELELQIADDPPLRYILSTSSLPPAMVLSLPKLYEQSLLNAGQRLHGEVVQRTDTTVGGIPASRYHLKTDTLHVYGLHVWADGTFYDLAALIPSPAHDASSGAEATRVLDSFSLDTFTAEEAAERRGAAWTRLGAAPIEWVSDFETCPADAASKAAALTTLAPDSCDGSAQSCVEECVQGSAEDCLRAGDAMSDDEDPRISAMAEPLYARACALGALEGCTSQAARAFMDDDRAAEWPCAVQTFATTCAAEEPWGCALHGAALARARGVRGDLGAAKSALARTCVLDDRSPACATARQLLRAIEAGALGDAP